MGNNSGRESRSSHHAYLQGDRGYSPHDSNPNSPSYPPGEGPQLYSSRHGRGSRPDLSTLFGFGGPNNDRERERDVSSLETRREAKAEREARRIEREKIAREKERERSMHEEHVDGGYLVTQGVYTGVEDFSKTVVRHLMVSDICIFDELQWLTS